MPYFKDKQCIYENCKTSFTPTGPASLYCPDHSGYMKKATARKSTQSYRIRHNLVEKPGVGKGGNNAKGVKDSQYKSGISLFCNERRYVVKDLSRVCTRCKKDLEMATRYEWCVHHIDHDRTNNEYDNLELLCKSCHQIEHECHKAFESVETNRKE